jgi:hypothetical protein
MCSSGISDKVPVPSDNQTPVQNNDVVRVKSFNSRVAYFRQLSNGFHHLLGAHYDFSIDELGHPAYHMQFDDYAELLWVIKDAFDTELEPVKNSMSGVPKRIRIPCAQLDTFSVATQVIADHLLGRFSSDTDKARFSTLLQQSGRLRGTGYLIPRLHTPQAYDCFRAVHWYPR